MEVRRLKKWCFMFRNEKEEAGATFAVLWKK